MFKEITKTDKSDKKCGVGSIFTGDTKYLLVEINTNVVGLMRMYDFKIMDEKNQKGVKVLDVNHLTLEEARQVGYLIGCTLSDFDIDNVGLKYGFTVKK